MTEVTFSPSELIADYMDTPQGPHVRVYRSGQWLGFQSGEGDEHHDEDYVLELTRADTHDHSEEMAKWSHTPRFAIRADQGDGLDVAWIDGEAYTLEWADEVVLTGFDLIEVEVVDDDEAPEYNTIDPDAERDALNAVREALTATLGAVLDIEDLDDVAPRLLAALRAELGGYLIDPAIVGVAEVNAEDGFERTREVHLNLDEPMADNYRWQSFNGAEWGPLQ